MTAASARNHEIYNDSRVASHYASLRHLSACEKYVFQNYLQPGMAILDIGVGGGRTTPYLSSLASRYVGLDYAEEMICACREKFPGIDFRTRDAADLSCFATGSFDAIVIAFNSIDYLVSDSHRSLCLRECNRVLRSGGVLVFSSHNPRSLVVRLSSNTERLIRLFRVRSFKQKTTQKVLGTGLLIAGQSYSVLRSCLYSIAKAGQRILAPAFWRGKGIWLDPAHGGLLTYTCVPKLWITELAAHGFRISKYLGNDFPRSGGRFMTDWYYYVFTKT